MSGAVFGFAPWLRRDAATLIEPPADPTAPRVILDLEAGFNQSSSFIARQKIELYGPGEITGLDARTVIRTWPGRDVRDAETDSFAHIEFDQADLPWRYTPAPVRLAADPAGSNQHVLSFEGFKGQRLPGQQQFSNNGAFWVWTQTPPPLVPQQFETVALITDFQTTGLPGGILGFVEFNEPVISVVVPPGRNFNNRAATDSWSPTLVFEGFAGTASVQRLEMPLDGGHLMTFTITAPASNPLTSLVMSVIAPPHASPKPRVEFDLHSITYVTAPKVSKDDGPDRLRPWCVLVVLRPEEILGYSPAASRPKPADGPIPLSIVKTHTRFLPDLSQSWAWAHVQVSGQATLTPAEAADLFEHAPQRLISRLLCPRQLEPGVAYRAFLVPAFERGRLTGLGEAIPAFYVTGSNRIPLTATLPAWTNESRNPTVTEIGFEIELPVYYELEFQTAANVDFKSLVLALRPGPLPEDVGKRTVDAGAVDPALPAASADPLWIEGALKSPATPPAWTPNEQIPFRAKLAGLVNAPAVGPPKYGRWLAARDPVNPLGTTRFDALNTDPRNRVNIGAGTRVVQENEQKMLDGAWQQIEGLVEINETLRFAQFARTVAGVVRDRRMSAASDESFLFMMAPLFRRVKAGTSTIATLVARSPIGRGPFESSFRRLLYFVRRRRRPSSEPELLGRMNRGEIAAAPRSAPPLQVVTADDVLSHSFPSGPPLANFTLVAEVGPGHPPPALPLLIAGGSDSPDAAGFRAAAKAMIASIFSPRTPLPQPVPIVFADLRTKLTDAADPTTAMLHDLQSRLHFAPGFVRASADPLEPILATPYFDKPMYEPLRKLSEEWILPGVAAFPANTISLAAVNQTFIEAYMLGLSHELSRSLLWHDYPTDQRGTHFRQFWDRGGYFGPRSVEQLRDILPIDSWVGASHAALNGSRPSPGAAEPLVLLVRGDVLRQYPTAIVYAARAAMVGGRREPATPPDERHPIFRGRLGGDMAFFGFELTAAEARGKNDGTDEGWFFILQEQPNEPRFGLEPGTVPAPPLTKWSDLRWSHFGSVSQPQYVNLNDLQPDTSGITVPPNLAWHADSPTTDHIGTTSAQLAWITLRRNDRVALHAADML